MIVKSLEGDKDTQPQNTLRLSLIPDRPDAQDMQEAIIVLDKGKVSIASRDPAPCTNNYLLLRELIKRSLTTICAEHRCCVASIVSMRKGLHGRALQLAVLVSSGLWCKPGFQTHS